MKIMIIGADGQLGTELCKVIPEEELIPLTIKEIDITDRSWTRDIVRKHRPDHLINTAAYNQVDQAENDPTAAFQINALGVKNLADACREIDAVMVHYSTDYVFDGKKGENDTPYTEKDSPDPRSIYGISKLAGEMILRARSPRHFLIRTAGLFGPAGCMSKGGGNFIENILKLAKASKEIKVVNDEEVSPTSAVDLARKTHQLILTKNYGLYHIVNHGKCSWYEFALKILEITGDKVRVIPVSTSDPEPGKAPRPRYSVLANSRLAELGMDDMPSWKEALQAYLLAR